MKKSYVFLCVFALFLGTLAKLFHLKVIPMKNDNKDPHHDRRPPDALQGRDVRRPTPRPAPAFVDGTGLGWKALGADDFIPVNGNPDTWTWNEGIVHCSGQPVGVTRTQDDLCQLGAGSRGGGT